jgi:hypothetical protein
LRNRIILSLSCILTIACDREDVLTDETILAVAVTGPGFYFFPPFGTMTTAPEPWEPRAYEHLTVAIDELDAALTPTRHLRTLSAATTPRLILHAPDEGFGVGWRTNLENLLDDHVYRVTVFADGRELGHADVDPRWNSHLRSKSALWIKFRVEQAAVDANLDGILDWEDQCAASPNCDDGDPCTDDRCDPASGCIQTPAADGPYAGSGPTTCGTGACAAIGHTQCSNGSVIDTCTPGQVLASADTSCDGIDDDCDGVRDDDYAPQSISCGEYENAPLGHTACMGGVLVDDCPAPLACSATTIPTNGTQVSQTTTVPGQSMAFEACGIAGRRWSFNTSFSNGCYRVTVTSPVGAAIVNNVLYCGAAFNDVFTLPISGAYHLRFTPYNNVTGTARVNLWDVPADLSASGTLGAPRAPALATTTPGQNARLLFTGSAGQRTAINVARNTGCYYVSLNAPNGAVAIARQLQCGTYFSDLVVLEQTGSYVLTLDGYAADLPAFTTDLYVVPENVSTSLVLGGAATSIPVTTPAQNASITFSGSAGQRTSFNLTRTTGCHYARLIAPSGAAVLSPGLNCGTYFSDLYVLTESGTHTWSIDPYSSDVATFTLSSYLVPEDPALTETIGGGAVNMPLLVPGQNGSITFAGTSGGRSSIVITRSGGCYRVSLIAPSGARPISNVLDCGSYFSELYVFAETGTYTLVINPNDADTATYSATIHAVPADLTVNGSIGGGSSSLPITTPAQNGFLTFSGASGQRITIQTTRNTGCYRRSLTSPSGATVVSSALSCGTYNSPTLTLAETGTFTFFLDANGTDTPTFTVTLANAP